MAFFPSHWIALLENSAGIAQLESAIAAADHDIADLGRKGSQTATEWGGASSGRHGYIAVDSLESGGF